MENRRLDIVFRFRPTAESPDGQLLQYLKRLGSTSISNEMVLKALRAFWLPDTYQNCGSKKAELKRLAQNTIFCLEEHANYLRHCFGIERQAPSLVQKYSLNLEMSQEQGQEQLEDDDSVDEVWHSEQRLDTGGL
jgi:hypothetical protein